jgi:uncharacterized protein
MSLTLDENRASYQIRGYQPGEIQINDLIYTNSVIIGPEKLIENGLPRHMKELNAGHLAILIDLHPTILLIGTGSLLQFPPIELYGDLINHGIGVEIMDTRAACRTYNALTAENRNVMAVLIIE